MSAARMESRSLSVQYRLVTCAAQMEGKVMRGWNGSPSSPVLGVLLTLYSVSPGLEYFPSGNRLNHRSSDSASFPTRLCKSCNDAIVIAVAVAAKLGILDVHAEEEEDMMRS